MSSQETNHDDTITLHMWPGEWNLPSFDPECLVALSFLKFTKLKHKVMLEKSTLNLLRNDYPTLVYQNELYRGLDSVIDFIKTKKNINLDIDDQNYATMLAHLNYFREKFIPAFKILCWIEEENTYTVIRRAYGKHLCFPFSFVKLRQMTSQAYDSIMCNQRATNAKIDTFKAQILNDARECLNSISNFLATNIFMLENQPTLIDAYLFGYLSILSRAPFVSSPLKNQLTICSNLGSMINRVLKDFFSVEMEGLEKIKDAEKERLKKTYWYQFVSFLKPKSSLSKSVLEQNEDWELQKGRMAALSVGLTAMFTYAVAMGIIKLNFSKTDIKITEEAV